jgi:hypothetical protein
VAGEQPWGSLDAARQDWVRVTHEHDRNLLGQGLGDLGQHALERRAGGERVVTRGLDCRTVRERIGEGHADLDQIGSGLRIGLAHPQRRGHVGKAPHQVGHQRGPATVGREGVRDAMRSGRDARVRHIWASPS